MKVSILLFHTFEALLLEMRQPVVEVPELGAVSAQQEEVAAERSSQHSGVWAGLESALQEYSIIPTSWCELVSHCSVLPLGACAG